MIADARQTTKSTRDAHEQADPVLAFEARQDKRDVKRLAHLQAQGHTHAVCSCCGEIRSLDWERWGCNNVDESTDSGVCEGVYRAQGGAA